MLTTYQYILFRVNSSRAYPVLFMCGSIIGYIYIYIYIYAYTYILEVEWHVSMSSKGVH